MIITEHEATINKFISILWINIKPSSHITIFFNDIYQQFVIQPVLQFGKKEKLLVIAMPNNCLVPQKNYF